VEFHPAYQTIVSPDDGHIVALSMWRKEICIPDSHPHRITSTKCRINTVVSPDDGHTVTRNMWRKINIIGKIVHQVGFIYKIVQGCTAKRT
jgi:hypothetical protein